jgi:hypothetical protein
VLKHVLDIGIQFYLPALVTIGAIGFIILTIFIWKASANPGRDAAKRQRRAEWLLFLFACLLGLGLAHALEPALSPYGKVAAGMLGFVGFGGAVTVFLAFRTWHVNSIWKRHSPLGVFYEAVSFMLIAAVAAFALAAAQNAIARHIAESNLPG